MAKALDWAHQLTSGKVGGVGEIAKAAGVTSSYVNRVVHAAFLAPDIIEAIGQGRQPLELTAMTLIAKTPLPLDWAEQRRLLGFPD